MVYLIFGAMAAVILLLSLKIYILKKSAREIGRDLESTVKADTNNQIRISSHDKDMRELASAVNVRLRELRKEHLLYHQGNTELKNAVTNISHDLRTPLTAICGYLFMIKKTEDRQQVDSYLSIIAERTETMKQLTEELFRYSVITSDGRETETEDVFVNRVLEESISSFYPALTEKGIVPQIDITEKRIQRNVSRSDLSRVFSNLLNNAVKYSSGDLDITMTDQGNIIFSNTAKELSSLQVEQLFDRFYTVEAARNSTGLGLSIARTLVERMGGTITAIYENDRLVITISLP